MEPNVYQMISVEPFQGFVIYSMDGKLLFEETDVNSRETIIDLSKITKTRGTFLLTILEQDVQSSHRIVRY